MNAEAGKHKSEVMFGGCFVLAVRRHFIIACLQHTILMRLQEFPHWNHRYYPAPSDDWMFSCHCWDQRYLKTWNNTISRSAGGLKEEKYGFPSPGKLARSRDPTNQMSELPHMTPFTENLLMPVILFFEPLPTAPDHSERWDCRWTNKSTMTDQCSHPCWFRTSLFPQPWLLNRTLWYFNSSTWDRLLTQRGYSEDLA